MIRAMILPARCESPGLNGRNRTRDWSGLRTMLVRLRHTPTALAEPSSPGWASEFHTVLQPAHVALEQSNLVPQKSSMIFLHGPTLQPGLSASTSAMSAVRTVTAWRAFQHWETDLNGSFNFKFGGSTTTWLSIPPDKNRALPQGGARERAIQFANSSGVFSNDRFKPAESKRRFQVSSGQTRRSQNSVRHKDAGGFPERSTRPMVGSENVRRMPALGGGSESIQLYLGPAGPEKRWLQRGTALLAYLRPHPKKTNPKSSIAKYIRERLFDTYSPDCTNV